MHCKIIKQIISCILTIFTVFALTESVFAKDSSTDAEQRQAIVEAAKEEVGYRESGKNLTKYGSYFGCNGTEWCAMFVCWCARQVGIGSNIIKFSTFATAYSLGLKYMGYSYDRNKKDDYTPVPGDMIIYDWASDGYNYKYPAGDYGDHIGIVEYVENGYVHTIEGNISDKVITRKIALTNEEIKGYGVPSYNLNHTHNYTISKTVKAATCSKTGVKRLQCSCGNYYDTRIKKTRHTDKNGDGKCDMCKNKISQLYTVDTPEITSIKEKSSSKAVVSWTAVVKADGYKIYLSKKVNSGYKLAKTTTSRSCTVAIKEYNRFVKVVAYRNIDKAVITSSATLGKYIPAKNTPAITTDSAIDNVKSYSATTPVLTANGSCLSWMTVNGAISYTVDYKKKGDSSYSSFCCISSNVGSINVGGLAKGTYYFRVKANIKSGSTVKQGQWSNIVTVKIK